MMRIHTRRIGRILALALILTLIFTATASARKASSSYKKPYYITVDLTNQIVTVYNTADDTIARQMICSAGKLMPTPKGTFYLPNTSRKDMRTENFYLFEFYDSYAKWATRIDGGILFHSVCFTEPNDDAIVIDQIKALGKPASHGCVRLRIDDAKFIAQNCLPGTMTKIYYSGEKNEGLWALLKYHSFEGDMSYERFCGTAVEADEIGLDATGSEISDLQARLKDLGYFTGSVSGTYDLETVIAVKRLQSRLELPVDGVYNTALDAVLFSENVPAGTDLTLEPGSVGLAVGRLQKTLTTMGFYSGPIDEIYDEEVAEAVKKFQHVNFFSEDGIATPVVQAGVYYIEEQMRETLGSLDDLSMESKSETVRVGILKTPTARKLHKKPSQESSGVGTVHSGEAVLVAGTKHNWAAIWTADAAGYTYTANLKIADRDNTVILYSKPDTDAVYQMGYTMAEFNTGKKSFAISFDRYYLLQQFFYADTVKRDYVTVQTGDDDVSLNLRAQPDGDAEILAEVPNGERLTAHNIGDDWTLVTWDGKVGYLMNDFLEVEIETEAELDDTIRISETAEVHRQASVVSTDGSGKAPVFDESAKKIGELPEGTVVDIILAAEDYEAAQISYQGHEGYMYLENLKSTAEDADAEEDSEGIEEEAAAEEMSDEAEDEAVPADGVTE